MTASVIFILKLVLTPLLVAGMSLAAKRFGPTFGGLIMGLPWMTGPILYFLTLDKGAPFAANAAVGILLAVVAIAAYMLAYAWASRIWPWWASLAAATVAFAATGVGLSEAPVDAMTAAILGVSSLLAVLVLMPRPVTRDGPRALPWWDIPMRMIATALMVAIITFFADRIGARLSGVVASFPVITTAVGCFSHARWGADAVLRLLRAMSLSLMAFVAFFSVIAETIVDTTPEASFVMATVSGLAISATLIVVSRLTRW